tara:strand:+ start:148 stop:528 length:381 start_codon:yes stop_codon:yes gene_type:complete
MSYILLIGLGGALGAISRYLVNQIAIIYLDSSLVGTFIVNISGSFLLGLLAGLLLSHPNWPEETKIFFAVGFLGSYTTFSTLSLATVQSLEKGDISTATINIGASLILGVIAAGGGIFLGKAIRLG